MPAAGLKIKGLNVFYGQGHILHDIALELAPREAVFILGLNGMGKTTLLRAIMGLHPPRAIGSIVYNENELSNKKPNEIASLGLGYVPQGRLLFPSLSVEEHLHLFYRPKSLNLGSEWKPDRVYSFFPALRERKNISGTLLSGGEQQMLAIARALVTNPTLLIMDEPTEGLSPSIIRQIVDTCQTLRKTGVSMLLTEQNLDVAAALGDCALILEMGRFVQEVCLSDCRNKDEFKLGLARAIQI